MSKLEKRVILLCSIYTLANTLSKSFINVYIYEYTNSLLITALYTLIRSFMFIIADLVGARLIKRYKYTVTIGTGLFMISVALLFVLTRIELFVLNKYYVLLVPLFSGFGEGMYWFSIGSCQQRVTSVQTRSKYLSILGICNNIMSFASPVIASFIIAKSINEMVGYRYILIFVFILYIFIIGVSLLINVKGDMGNDYSLKECLSIKDKRWGNVVLGTFFYGIANGLTINLTSVLLYNASGSGGLYSKLLIVFSLITVISLRFLPFTITKNRIKTTYLIATLINVSSVVVLCFASNIYGAIYYGIANALTVCFYDNSYSKISMDTTSYYMDDLTGRVIAKEFCVSMGRVIAMAFIVLCYFIFDEINYLKISVIVLSMFPLISYCYFKKNI